MPKLNALGTRLASQLVAAKDAARQHDAAIAQEQKIHVVGAGATVTAAYEQLRNAAEYTEEHLLLEKAILRFYRRLFLARDHQRVSSSADELIVELTHAGYLKNDSIPQSCLITINQKAVRYFEAYLDYGPQKPRVEAWTTMVLASEVEAVLNSHAKHTVFVQFCHEYFKDTVNQEQLFGSPQKDFEVALYVAIHKALLRSDEATIRAMLLQRYHMTPENRDVYRSTNEQIDTLLASPAVEKLFRAITRQGAPFRVLWRMIDGEQDVSMLLGERDRFLNAYQVKIAELYHGTRDRINRGIVKSIVFLIITKFLVGLAIEVPYDYVVHGSIVWLPLVINLLSPPVYMLLLRTTLMLPGEANTAAIMDIMDNVLFGEVSRSASYRRANRSFGAAYNVAYAIFFLLIFGSVSWLLLSVGFTLLHLIIFFIFFSTASFLGFRLSTIVRELEVVESAQNSVTVIRDFLYMPFVVVGRWISEKYSRFNFVAIVLDMIIELPLKTVLRLIRQWSAFISSKKDEL